MNLQRLHIAVSVCVAALLFGEVRAQNACFTMENLAGQPISAGCIPDMIVQFVDCSTDPNGAPITYSEQATGGYYSHHWTFRYNNGFSNAQSPVYGFFDPGVYTICLTVTHNGVNFDSVSHTITVYEAPQVNMTSDVTDGCNPLTVNFTDLSTSNNGPINSWLWDFCDGGLSTQQNPSHTFHMTQQQNCFCVTLKVTNGLGCVAAKTFDDAVCIDRPPVANFNSDVPQLCDSPYVIHFYSTSQSANPLTYLWDFGDSTTATDSAVTHIYSLVGDYTVSLTVTDTLCHVSKTITRLAYVKVHEIHADFLYTKQVFCDGECTQFIDSSTATSSNLSYRWNFPPMTGTQTGQNPNVCPPAGTYDATLVVTDEIGCSDTLTKLNAFTVNPKPDAAFTAPATVSCSAPFDVTFNVTHPCSTCTYTWSFGDPDSTTSQVMNPTFTYDTIGTFTVIVEVTNANGCNAVNIAGSFISIDKIDFDFEMDSAKGCKPHNVDFRDITSVPAGDFVAGWVWDFGDSSTSNLQNSTHTYTDAGKYTVKMSGITHLGCAGEVTDTVYVGQTITPDFSFLPNPACVNEPVQFVNLTNTNIVIPSGDTIQWYWDFQGAGTSTVKNPPPKIYVQPDTFTVKLAAGVLGCMDTVEKQLIILEPKAEFYIIQDCATPATIEFRDTSKGADTWLYYFGDSTSGVPNTSTLKNPIHTYTKSGIDSVLLIVTNLTTGCKDSFTKVITVSLVNADFTVAKTEVCIGEAVQFTDNSDGIGLQWYWSSDGRTSRDSNATFSYSTVGKKSVKLKVRDILGCEDSLTKVDIINVTGVMADFRGAPLIGCIPPTGTGNVVNFTNLSSFLGSPTQNMHYTWNFGEGAGDTSAVFNPTKTYNTPGGFNVSLTVTSDSGCTSTKTLNHYIDIKKPDACFNTPGTVFCAGQTVSVTNCTQGGGTFTWSFCDTCANVVGVNPSHVYNDTGTYTIKMWVVDGNGCVDTATPVTIVVAKPELGFRVPNDTSYCPPFVACFEDSIEFGTLDPDSVLWSFGDGSFSKLEDPCHIYTRPGKFDVTLTVWFPNLCVDSLTVTGAVRVGGATGHFQAMPDTGCVPMPIVLDVHPQGAASIYWYIPWDEPHSGIYGDTIHSVIPYDTAGIFIPWVVLTDTQTPYPCSYILYADTVIAADSVNADFTAGSDSVCRADPIQFIDSSYTVVGDSIVKWHWYFGGFPGDTSNLQNPTHAFTIVGWHSVTLTATSKIGCSNTVSKQIYVLDKPTAAFTVSDPLGCDSLQVTFTNHSTPGINAQIQFWDWNFGDSTSGLNNIHHGIVPPPHLYADTGTYSPFLVVTDYNGCDDTATIPINVYKTPDGIILPGPLQICQKDTVQLFTDSFTYSGYTWTPPDGLSDPHAQHPYASPLVTTLYTVAITEGHGCDKSDTVRVRVLPLPPLTLTPQPSVVICWGDSIQLTAGGAPRYHWVFNDGSEAIFLSPSATVPDPVAFPPASTCYIVRGTDATGCVAKDTVCIVVSAVTAQFLGERNCLGDSTNFLDLSSGTELKVVNWHWDFGDTGTSTEQFPAHTYADSGRYHVQLIAADSSGCTDTARGTTIIDFPPDAAAGPNSDLCLGDSLQLFATGGDTFFWTPGPYILNPVSANPTVFPNATTTYIAHVTYGVCPWDTAEVEVTVRSLPEVQTIEDTHVARGETIELTTTVDKYEAVSWNPPDSLNCDDCLSPLARPYVKTEYKVTAVDEFGCKGYDSVVIDVDVECKDDQVFVANAFSPNGDGLNDVLHLHLRGIEKINYFRIYDRWGKLMFETKDMNEGWDGKNKSGQQLSSAVYVYVAEAVCFYGKTIVKTGNVTLIK